MTVKFSHKKYAKSGEDENFLWNQFKANDKSAYSYFYESYAALLFRYGCKISTDRELVKDCIHDLFTELWKNKANLSNPVSVKNYLVKSLRNKLLREISKQSKFVNKDSIEEADFGFIHSNEFEMIHAESKNENEKQLINALRKLSNKQKEIIFLLYYNNLSPAEVAAIMSVSIRTIYNTTFNAIQSLKGEMVSLAIFFFLFNFAVQ